MASVSCHKCGFITLREHGTRNALEVEKRTRETGHPTANTEQNPTCFVDAQEIEKQCKEVREKQFPTNPALGVLKVIQETRDCDRFTPWIPGSSPKEHQDMLNSQQLQTEQQKQRERDREWELRQELAARDWQEKQEQLRREREDARDKSNREYQELQAKSAGERQQAKDKANDERQEARDKANRDFQAKQHELNRRWSGKLALFGVFVSAVGFLFGRYFSNPPVPQFPEPQPIHIHLPSTEKTSEQKEQKKESDPKK